MVSAVGDVASHIARLDRGKPTFLVAIDGKGGAGKTTIASGVAAEIAGTGRKVAIVHLDDFYVPSSVRRGGVGKGKRVADHFDWERLREEVLVPLRGGRAARYARYDWDNNALGASAEVQPGHLVIVEGVSSSRKELAPFYDVRVWVDCPRDLRLARGLARDGEAVRDRWEKEWMPAEDTYVEEHRPDAAADIVVCGFRS